MLTRLLTFFALLPLPAQAQAVFHETTAAELSVRPEEYVFPGERWQRVTDPGQLGWDEARLAELEEMAPEVGSSAGLVIHRGLVVAVTPTEVGSP